MHRNVSRFLWLIAVSLVLILTAGIVSAAPVTQSISFQGNLTNATGTPLTGKYTVTFRLYNVASGGTALANDTHSVTATKGKFTTTLNFPATNYNGQGLWLGIKNGSDPEKTPRTIFRPVPYALGLRPGATINGSAGTFALKLQNDNADGTGLSVSANGSSGKALFATTSGANSPAVWGSTSGSDSLGVYAKTTGSSSPGIVVSTTGQDSSGIQAFTTNTSSPAIYGSSTRDIGVVGKGIEGGYFTTRQAGSYGYPKAGVNVSTKYNYNPGILINTTGPNSEGIVASTTGNYSRAILAGTYGDTSWGANIYTQGKNSPGAFVVTSSSQSDGIISFTNGEYSDGITSETIGDNSDGISVDTYGKSSYGVVAHAYGNLSYGVYATSKDYPAILAVTDRLDHKYGVQTPDIIRAYGYETGASDVAEYLPVTGDVEPGMVLVIAEDGNLQISSSAYDTGVAGIVSTTPGVSLGAKEGGNPGEQLIAVAGRVPCKVDASNGPIYPRDLLTTSSNPGYAMKATNPQVGTVLGKAMGTLKSGTGTIEVLVTLQ